MNNYIYVCFLFFIVYSFLGWCVESINEIATTKKFVNRGFLIGPYLPIYGCGGLLITFLLQKYADDVLVLFILSMVVCSILEYLTSYILEKLFNARWWDYSDEKFNINGRISLRTMIPFGLLGLLMIYYINPFLNKIINTIPSKTVVVLSTCLFIIFIFDLVVSISILDKIKNTIKRFEKDNTEEISNRVKEVLSKNWITRRIVNAFPSVKYLGIKIKNNINRVLTKEELRKEKIKIDTEARLSKMKLNYDYRVQKINKRTNNRIKRINKK